jgi:dTDP-4-dehydrorhamnose reductase
MKLVLGDGMLGSQLVKDSAYQYISRKKNGIDFNSNIESYFELISFLKPTTVINCIANTDTYNGTKEEHYTPNYHRVIDLVKYCNKNKIKLVHISSDYVYANSEENAKETSTLNPIDTYYGLSKMEGDLYVQNNSNDFLTIRTSFKPNPFPYNKVVEQIGNFDYVDVISKLIITLIGHGACGVYNVGTNKKTMYKLASMTRSDLSFREPIHEKMPKDISMNITKLERVLYGV